MARKVELFQYDPKWIEMFQEEARALAGLLSPQLIAIHHVGSTSIPGIHAKPVIDILIEVRDIETIHSYSAAMEALGYEPRGEHGIPGRRYFYKEANGIHSHHVHIFGQGHPEIGRHLRFRDHLRAHPEVAKAYSQLKRRLAQIYPEDADGYTEAKSPFILEIDERARPKMPGRKGRIR
jgi:GrpB-like predicted nucleotidyltransferase (UPF0157 family)